MKENNYNNNRAGDWLKECEDKEQERLNLVYTPKLEKLKAK